MEQNIHQGQKFATLLLASSILIAGLLIGGAIITRNGLQVESAEGEVYPQQNSNQPQGVGTQAPSCGV